MPLALTLLQAGAPAQPLALLTVALPPDAHPEAAPCPPPDAEAPPPKPLADHSEDRDQVPALLPLLFSAVPQYAVSWPSVVIAYSHATIAVLPVYLTSPLCPLLQADELMVDPSASYPPALEWSQLRGVSPWL